MGEHAEHVDIAACGELRWWTGGERHDLRVHPVERDAQGCWRPGQDPQTGLWHLGLEWDAPRDIHSVAVEYAHQPPLGLEVHYWRMHWPTPAPERRPGARRGWIGRDDPWHGRWTRVRGEYRQHGHTVTVHFDPIDLPELGRESGAQLEEAENYLAPFRRTLKLRVVSGGDEAPQVKRIQVFSTARWAEGTIAIIRVDGGEVDGLQVEAFNGEVLESTTTPDGLQLHLHHASRATTPGDETLLTLRTPEHTFTFRLRDLESGPLYLPDYKVYIARPGHPHFADYLRQLETKPKNLYDRVEDEPEQNLARAMAEIPPLDVTKQAPFGRYVALGIDGGRQEWALRYNGELFADKRELKLAGRDAARLLWPGQQLRFRFGSGDPPDFREGRKATQQSRLEGWLPVFTSRWLDREIEYEQTAFAAPLAGPMQAAESIRGDEDVVALVRFTLRNTTHGTKQALLWTVIAPHEQVELRDGLLLGLGRVVPDVPVQRQWQVDPYPTPYLRSAIDIHGRGHLSALPLPEEVAAPAAVATAVLYRVELAGGESHSLTFAFPFVSLSQQHEWQAVQALKFDEKLQNVIHYWRELVETGGRMELPDRVLSDFHKAVRIHVALTADKDPASGLFVVPAATWRYGACGNEACWQITMLDQAGHHRRAEAYLETFLATQGTIGPDGLFASKEGAFQGLDLDDGQPIWSHFGYNLDHGYIMECLANHYRYTGDTRWLERVSPHLVAACDFVIRERQATQVTDDQGEPALTWGLLPPGHLEDNPEWRHWFAVNAHAYAGLQAIADVLADIDHPEASRLAEAATAYRDDIRQAARRSMALAPVERLSDGTAVPHIPTRAGLRGREWGWFREAAYGALHLMECGVFEPWEPEVTWLLKDLEDNLFVSREWGRPVDRERHWFSHGGITIQPNLMDLAIDYLRRGQIKHALRALFNNFTSSLYPDVRVFTEHPVVELGHGVGPFYKTPDESKSLIWLRAFLLREEGETLHLAQGVPRAWLAPGQHFGVQGMASFFGPVSYQVEAGDTEITGQVRLTAGRLPQALHLHLRHPEQRPIQAVTVNGRPHADFDPAAEVVRVRPVEENLLVQISY